MKVAVIGAGASGLAAIKCCLDEGLTPVCFEKSDHIGGLWQYKDQPVSGRACVMKSTVINTCKELLCFSDFPIPAHFAPCMRNSQVVEYFHLYANHFGLKQHIHYNTVVVSVSKTDNHNSTGRWNVRHRDVSTGLECTEVFDAVMACNGYQSRPYMPELEGIKDFQGQVLHTNDYRTPAGFEDKRVLVVGVGNSGGDCAVDVCKAAKQVFISTRAGTWVTHRLSENGYPHDLVSLTRFRLFLHSSCRGPWEKYNEWKLNSRYNHTLYRLKPSHSLFSSQPMINDDLPSRMLSGAIQIRNDVKRFTQTGVEFVDGTTEELDAVILATGYKTEFPFLSQDLLKRENKKIPLYKVMFPPDQERDTLAIIGCLQIRGSLMPMAEMQCRVATRVFKGLVSLPDRASRWQEIQARYDRAARTSIPTQRYTLTVNQAWYMDELSDIIGCRPDFWTLFKKEPLFALRLWFGPTYPFSYRLLGPGKWAGARTAIDTAMERMRTSFKTRDLPTARTSTANKWKKFIWCMMILAACMAFIVFYLDER
ncbi:dimethylaniline monooxygenase [N-oxide-forming] [Elysia marginata]|uniref:Flavin-containing monooxygenase n=1 Tax=Elysia marginata TaxID=1093978 RepID=A0AAV4GDW8_9GAST|nr:dimethylaniline monooxygenase [N-oxide-forming] [Elysia marginata]